MGEWRFRTGGVVLKARSTVWAIAAAAFGLAAATAPCAVQAETATPFSLENSSIRTIDPNHAVVTPARHSLQWAQASRWGVKLDMSQPSFGQSVQLRDVQAGAYYRVTPQLRVGVTGAFTEGGTAAYAYDHTLTPSAQAPQVKLETSFKF